MDVISVEARDFESTGIVTDIIEGPITITPGGEQYVATAIDVPAHSRERMTVTDNGLTDGNTQELGILLITNADRGPGARGGATENTEALIIPTKAAKKDVKMILKD